MNAPVVVRMLLFRVRKETRPRPAAGRHSPPGEAATRQRLVLEKAQMDRNVVEIEALIGRAKAKAGVRARPRGPDANNVSFSYDVLPQHGKPFTRGSAIEVRVS